VPVRIALQARRGWRRRNPRRRHESAATRHSCLEKSMHADMVEVTIGRSLRLTSAYIVALRKHHWPHRHG
jgi:hypothetical protein